MTAIEFEHISKQYQLGKIGTGTLSKDLNRWWASIRGKEDPYLRIGQTNNRTQKAEGDFVWALRDINFKVEQGDVVGIIGKNGSGKSTLLKILSKVTSPTTGFIRGRGRVASLLEVGTGFHPEMTGRENIYMNGVIMGMTKAEIDRKLDEIVDFAGVAMYVDTPVKRYSSGMMVRLGFAVAAHLEPEILVVDEVLAVGDAEFQKKALGKMHDVSHNDGRTVLFVSHNMNAVKALCNRGVVLENGVLEYTSSAIDCISHYINTRQQDVVIHTVITDEYRPDLRYSRKLELKEVSLLNDNPYEMATDEPIILDVKLKRNSADINDGQVCCIINSTEGQRLCYYIPDRIKFPKGQDEFIVRIQMFDAKLPKGNYNIRLEAGRRDFSNSSNNDDFDSADNVISFNIQYIHKEMKDEYLHWRSEWATRIDWNRGVVAKLI